MNPTTNKEKRQTMTTIKTLQKADLAQFTGSEQWFRHALVRSVLFTDGAKHVADAGGAYWLLDEIALAQRYKKRVVAEAFQNWTLKVKDDNTARLTCDDGNGNIVFSKRIPFTDFRYRKSAFISATTPFCCRASIDAARGRLMRGRPFCRAGADSEKNSESAHLSSLLYFEARIFLAKKLPVAFLLTITRRRSPVNFALRLNTEKIP